VGAKFGGIFGPIGSRRLFGKNGRRLLQVERTAQANGYESSDRTETLFRSWV
jgi:hypothetical protein